MKTVVIGDIHGRSVWKLITHIENPDRVIFVGDYFDSFDIKGADQLSNFQDIIAYKESEQCEVILLIGNHDHHYFPEIGNTGTSGYQHLFAPSIQYVVGENRKHLQMAYQMDEYLFTHAGVSSVYMDQVFGKDGWNIDNVAEELNELFKYKPKSFTFGSYALMNKMSYLDPYGDSEDQSPIWIRPKALMRANKGILRKQIIQIFGHTQIDRADTKGGATGGRYYNIDCLGTSGEYMIIEDGKISFNSWKNN
jgi:predicted MPP superfamily phosphohydrolase